MPNLQDLEAKLREHLERDPASGRLRVALADALFARDKEAEAREVLLGGAGAPLAVSSLLALVNHPPVSARRQFLALVRSQEEAGALDAFFDRLAVDATGNAEFKVELIEGLSAAGLSKQAESALRRLLAADPGSSRIAAALVDLLQSQVGAASTLDAFLAAHGWERYLGDILDYNPKSLCWQLGRILERAGDRAAAGLRQAAGTPAKRALLVRRLIDLGEVGLAEGLLSESGGAGYELRLMLGKAFGQKELWEEAGLQFEGAVAAAPRELDGRLCLAHALMRQGRHADAEAAFARLPGDQAGSYDVVFARARLYAAENRLDEAAAAYERAIAARPAEIRTYLFLAETLMQQRAVEAFFDALRRAKAAVPYPAADDVDGLVERHKAMMFLCDPEVIRTGEDILDRTRRTDHIDPLRMGALVPEFDLTIAAIEYKRAALPRWDKLIAENPGTPWGTFYRALMLTYHEGYVVPDFNERRRQDIESFSRFPASRYGWMLLERGKERLYHGDIPGALVDFEAVVGSTDGGNWTAQGYIGEARFFQGDVEGALEAFDLGIRMSPEVTRGWALAWKGQILNWSGRFKQALPVLDEAIRRSGQYAIGWKGGALINLGRAAEALPVLERAVAVNPWDDEESAAWYCDALVRLGRPKDALAHADEALGPKRMTNFYIRVVRGLARAATGDAAGAKEDLAAVPPEVVGYVAKRSGLAPQGDPAAFLAKILEFSAGVRRPGFVLQAWMR